MSNDMKLFLKGFAALVLVGVVVGGVFWARSQWLGVRQKLMLEELRTEELKMKQSAEVSAKRVAQQNADRRASALRKAPTHPPQTSQPGHDGKRTAYLRHVSFSPDKRFLAAIAESKAVNELVVWPATGGPTILRHKLEFANYHTAHWIGPNRIFADDIIWRIHKDNGYWQLTQISRLRLQRENRNWVERFRDFPQQDIRLQVEDYAVSQGHTSHTKGRLQAYSLATGVLLPLPKELEAQNDLTQMKPLARWGKSALRVAHWKSFDRPTAEGLSTTSELTVWDARQKKRLWKKSFPDTNGTLLIGSNGNFIVAVGTPRRLPPSSPDPPGTEYYYNGRRVDKMPVSDVGYSMNGVEVYDSATGANLAQKTVNGMMTMTAIVSPDGKYLAIPVSQTESTGKRAESALLVYEARALRMIKKLALPSVESPAAFSSDNKYLIVTAAGKLHLYNWQLADNSGKAPLRMAWL